MSNVLATNKTLSSITVSAWTVYYINSSNAELVTVYDSSNNPYDCFKYLLNNISYYYVLDGVQNAWVNDLSSIGYSLIPVVVVLPTVILDNWLKPSSGGATVSFTPDLEADCYRWVDGVGYQLILYDITKSYAVIQLRNEQSSILVSKSPKIELFNNNGSLSARNISSDTLSIQQASYAICSSTDVEVVTVYDANNYAFNAFKYSVNGADYYYVLEPDGWGTKVTDWTSNLGSIGYKETLDVLAGMSIDNSTGELISVTFDYPQYNYWTVRVRSAENKYGLDSLGLWFNNTFKYGSLKFDNTYNYSIIEFYTDIGETVAPYNVSDFIANGSSAVLITCKNGSYSTPVKTCLIRITTFQTEVLLGLKWKDGNWVNGVDVSNDYWWAGILNSDDHSLLNSHGLVYSSSTYPYKELKYDPTKYKYEFVALYSDVGETEIPTNASDFYVSTAGAGNVVAIFCIGTYTTLAKTWKCRITHRV